MDVRDLVSGLAKEIVFITTLCVFLATEWCPAV